MIPSANVRKRQKGSLKTLLPFLGMPANANAVEPQNHTKLMRGLLAKDFRLCLIGQARRFKLEKPEKQAWIVLLVELGKVSGACDFRWPARNVSSAFENRLD